MDRLFSKLLPSLVSSESLARRLAAESEGLTSCETLLGDFQSLLSNNGSEWNLFNSLVQRVRQSQDVTNSDGQTLYKTHFYDLYTRDLGRAIKVVGDTGVMSINNIRLYVGDQEAVQRRVRQSPRPTSNAPRFEIVLSTLRAIDPPGSVPVDEDSERPNEMSNGGPEREKLIHRTPQQEWDYFLSLYPDLREGNIRGAYSFHMDSDYRRNIVISVDLTRAMASDAAMNAAIAMILHIRQTILKKPFVSSDSHYGIFLDPEGFIRDEI
jgi:hypothetical protein